MNTCCPNCASNTAIGNELVSVCTECASVSAAGFSSACRSSSQVLWLFSEWLRPSASRVVLVSSPACLRCPEGFLLIECLLVAWLSLCPTPCIFVC